MENTQIVSFVNFDICNIFLKKKQARKGELNMK